MEYTRQELMNFFNAMDDVFYSVDRVNMRLIQISKACEKIYGYTDEDFLKDHLIWLDMVHPSDRHIVADETERLERGEHVSNSYRIIRKDGDIRWVEKRMVPSFSEAGVLVRVDGIIRDITAAKKNEQEQSQNEERYRRIVETAQEGVWTIDEHNRTNFVNKKTCEILGYTPEEMIGRDLFDLMDEEDKPLVIERLKERRQGKNENLDIRYKSKNGKYVWTNIAASPIFDNAGNYKGSLAMMTDITRRKQNEEALKISEANLRTIFDNTDSSYVLFDEALNIISFNALAQAYSVEHNNGRQLEAGRSIKGYFEAERWPHVEELLERVNRDGSAEYEISAEKEDGSIKWFHVRWLMVRNNEHQHRGYILANKEITATKVAALERERITNDLIQHNKDLEQFTYIISHNLRTPVANIMGLADLLVAGNVRPEDKGEVFEMVAASIQNLDMVIRDLNHILQMRSNRGEKKERVNFELLVDSIRQSILNIDMKDDVHFDGDFSHVAGMYTIRSYIYSIFYNLLSNSVKFRRPEVPASISITGYQFNDKIELRFKDNGKGIDLEKNGPNLFGLYKRFDTSTEGKGMGLFMVKTQVEALGGTIKVNSQPGEGTEFVIRLPAH